MSAPPQQIDSRVRIVTPENIAFEYRVAGPFARIGAYLLDLLIIAGGVLLTGIFTALVGNWLNLRGVGSFGLLVLLFFAYWFYGGLFEWRWNGQTPGKRIVGLRVLRADGRPIAAWQAILRNFLRLIDLYPYVYFADGFGDMQLALPTCLFGLIVMACTARHQRIGDLACMTMVVAEEPAGSGRAAKDWAAAGETASSPALQQMLTTIPASYRPGQTLARALSHYASRRRYLGPARRREIAAHVGRPLTEQLNLPPQTDHDLLLSALYVRTFLNDTEGDDSGGDTAK